MKIFLPVSVILFFSIFSFSISAEDQKIPNDKQSLKKMIWETIEELRLYERANGKEEESLQTIYDDGFYLVGKDDTLRIGGWYQGDLNIFTQKNDGSTRFRNRRARLDIRGILEDHFEYRFFPQFAGASANLQEAWLQYKYFPNFRMRLGQFKVPFSLESQYSSLWTDFVEKSIGVGNLEPAEDVGFMIYGNPFQGRLIYAVGVFNGRSRTLEDNNDAFDGATRLIFAPFKISGKEIWKELYVGGSLAVGQSKEDLADTGFSAAGGNRFATYGSATRHAGLRRKYGAELQWIFGPGDIKSEYLSARFDDVDRSGQKEDVDINAWYLSISYLLTGEKKPKDRWVVPNKKFGAWEIAVRIEQFHIIEEAHFQAGLLTGSNSATAATTALNWWPNKHIRLMLNYEFTNFDEGVLVGGEVENDESLFLLRTQYNF
ncbi:MAG: porin [Deltaproteobacteria bacterium]